MVSGMVEGLPKKSGRNSSRSLSISLAWVPIRHDTRQRLSRRRENRPRPSINPRTRSQPHWIMSIFVDGGLEKGPCCRPRSSQRGSGPELSRARL